MSSQAIAVSRSARLLLELAAAGADCRVSVGGRSVLMVGGAVADIQGAGDDLPLLAFLVAAGRITDAERDAIAESAGGDEPLIERALSELPSLGEETLRDARRAMLLDRLVRGLAREDEEATEGPLGTLPEALLGGGTRYETSALVLDALARRAARAEAELIGGMQGARIHWLDAPGRAEAERWAELGELRDDVPLGALFPRHPAAPSRIAALLRAGVARLDGVRAPEPARAHRASSSRRDAVTQTAPPAAQSSTPTGPLGIVPLAPWLPRGRAPLGDPVQPHEDALAALAPTGDARVDAAARALLWCEIAQAVRTHQHAPLEAARAAREAVAAAPEDAAALALAASLSATCGMLDVAPAYARARVAQTKPGDERVRAWLQVAHYARRAGALDEARDAVDQASDAEPDDWTLHAALARAFAQRGDLQAAVDRAVEAARRARVADPERASAILEWAAKLMPGNLRTWDELAKSLARQGRTAAASATLARAARVQTDVAVRARLRLSAIGFAELAGSAVAGELLLEALDTENRLPEPLARHLEQTGAWVELAVIAQDQAASATGPERAALLLHAARAYEKLPGGTARALTRLCDALVIDPGRAFDALSALATAEGRNDLLCDALERALCVRCPDVEEARTLAPELRAPVRWLIERLVAQPIEVLGAARARLVLALREALDGHGPSGDEARLVREHSAAYEAQAEQLEHALRNAPKAQRGEPGLRLAALYARDPARRSIARRLYGRVLEREPARAEINDALAQLLWLAGDDDALRALHAQRSVALPTAVTQLELAYAERRAENLAAAQAACHAALSQPGTAQHEAQVLRWRLALAAQDHAQVSAALATLAAHAESREEAARMLLRLARAARAAGDREAAVRAADDALERDPSSAEAALWLRDEAALLSPERRLPALRRARKALGEGPELLRQLARACYAAGDARGQREALEALLPLMPDDGFAARALVALLTTGSDASALSAALRTALAPSRFELSTLPVAESGLARLASIADAGRAVEIVVSAVDALGEQARPLLRIAGALAHELSNADLRTRVEELSLAHARVEEQPEWLRLLATHWRERDVPWAEARTQLRLLALVPDDPRAIERLAAIYAGAGDARRADAVMSLAHDLAATDQVRRERLFDRAQVAALLSRDTRRAAELITQALSPTRASGETAGVPLEALRRGIGLLCTLAPEQALGLLLTLSKSAPTPRSRDLVEEALMLAEHALGRPDLALDMAVEGTLRDPMHEPFARALERLSRATGALEVMVATLEKSADRCREPVRQAELFSRAATLAEQALDDPGRACLALDQAYRATPTPALEEQLISAARRLYARDLHAGKRAYDRLRDALHVRAKFGAPIARTEALITLAQLALEVYLAPHDSQRYAEAAEATLAAAHDATLVQQTDAREALNALQARLTQESMRSAAPSARRPGTDERADPQLAPTVRPPARASSMPPGRASSMPAGRASSMPAGRASSMPADRASSMPPDRRVTVPAPAPAFEASAPLASLSPVAIRSQAAATAVTVVPGPSDSVNDEESEVRSLERSTLDDVDALAARLADDDSLALQAISELLLREPAGAARVCESLLAAGRSRQFCVCLLRGLRGASASANAHALWRTSSQALAFIEPALRPPPTARRREAHSERAARALARARAVAHEPAFALLAQLVESAAPMFRAGKQRLPRDLSPLREPPYGQLLAELAQLLEARHEVYRVPTGEDRVALTSALPASILIGDRTPPDAAALRFRLARAFEYGRPDNVLLAILDDLQCEVLFSALSAAFAPATREGTAVPRAAASVAAELWNMIPKVPQRTIARALQELPEPLDHAALCAATRLRGARVALFATRSLDVALAQLGLDGDPPEARIAPTAQGLDSALREEPLVRGLVAYAFSDEYLQSLGDQD